MEFNQLDPEEFGRIIEIALEYGGILIVVLSLLAALIGRGKKREKKAREAALGKTRSEAEPIEPGDDTGKLSERMNSRR